MPDIDEKRFWFQGEHQPPRTAQEFYKWREQNGHGRYPMNAIPIYPGQPYDRFNPVWNSIRDLNEYARRIPGWFSGMQTASDSAHLSRRWCWGWNLGDMLALYDRGWAEGFEAVRMGMDHAAQAALAKAMPVEDLEKHVSGSFVDVPSYIRGEPEAMYEFADMTRDMLHLEVEVDYCIDADTPSEEVLFRGVSVMAAVMALRRMGVFVTLYGKIIAHSELFFEPEAPRWVGRGRFRRRVTSQPNKSRQVTATVHMMNQDLTENLSEVLLFLCHPGYYRKVFFQAISAAWGINYLGIAGQARNTDDFFPKPGSGKIVIPGHFTGTSGSDDTGIDWGNTWASPKAAEMMVANMLQCATPTHR
jgi:hypothetical protein